MGVKSYQTFDVKVSSTISSSSTVVQVIRPSTTNNSSNAAPCGTIPENRSISNAKSPKSSMPGKKLSKILFQSFEGGIMSYLHIIFLKSVSLFNFRYLQWAIHCFYVCTKFNNQSIPRIFENVFETESNQ